MWMLSNTSVLSVFFLLASVLVLLKIIKVRIKKENLFSAYPDNRWLNAFYKRRANKMCKTNMQTQSTNEEQKNAAAMSLALMEGLGRSQGRREPAGTPEPLRSPCNC